MEVRLFVREDGRCPYEEWFESLRDARTRDRVTTRVGRLFAGNLGDLRSLGEGLHELRLPFGPGYRIYCALRGSTLVILLSGGDKSGQARDIRKARELLIELEDQDHG